MFVCACIRACLSPEQTLLARYLGYLLTEFDQTFATNRLGAKMNASNVGVQKVKGQGNVGSNMPQNALFGFVSTKF